MKRPALINTEGSALASAGGLVAAGLAATAVIGYLHYRSGLAYEFHILFLLPAALIAWFAGWLHGMLVAFAALLVWGIADWHLGGATASRIPLLINSGMRLGVFLVVTWLLTRLRVMLARETELAHHDPLTGLPNRRLFYAEGERALSQAHRRQETLTVMFIDLDRFKQVNDELGHKAGDELLQVVAGVLRQQVRGSDIVGRLGGDEFAVLLPGMAGDAAAAYAEKLHTHLKEQMAGHHWPVGFSIGLACFRSPPPDIDALVQCADALMYQAKRAGRGGIHQETYTGAMPPVHDAQDG